VAKQAQWDRKYRKRGKVVEQHRLAHLPGDVLAQHDGIGDRTSAARGHWTASAALRWAMAMPTRMN